jgi:hypothetical protein
MARKTFGKRGSAIIVMVIVGAIAASPSTAGAARKPPRPLENVPASVQLPVQAQAHVPVQVSVPAVQVQLFTSDRASWAEASWAEE